LIKPDEPDPLDTIEVDPDGTEWYLGRPLVWWEGICGTGLRKWLISAGHMHSGDVHFPDLSKIEPPFPWSRDVEIALRRASYQGRLAASAQLKARLAAHEPSPEDLRKQAQGDARRKRLGELLERNRRRLQQG
jgi:hypothetical protein